MHQAALKSAMQDVYDDGVKEIMNFMQEGIKNGKQT